MTDDLNNQNNPYPQGSFLYHHFEAERLRNCSDHYFVWEKNFALWDDVLNRPIGFPARQAFLLAAACIIFNDRPSVYVQKCAEFYAQKYHNSKILHENKKGLTH